ncbi:ribosomal-processing cysteine protease Prp [Salinibacillus xinjiangensis]|uniref:Ribosomal processing cysteine protease Prp n=1 Tax=Salinibacillus xinjiangensis TaxID=1229268 RepID=A0A6G1XBH6_9BACI|nr:ribosomal-processing cysteine protease Prp [Salinibacillus xinjiangensis]MRG88230.1 ribosomal-processing cysteine protease Prp [Salinibacillus xinjiangensis]
MINVRIYRNEKREITSFELEGHAESGPHGHDLVCAAVSAVSFGAVNAVIKLCEIEPIIEQGGEGGYLKMKLPLYMDQEVYLKAQHLLEGMVVSLETIERDYHQYITIS